VISFGGFFKTISYFYPLIYPVKQTMIIAENITKKYGDLEVLKGINLIIEESQIVSIVGSSGAGKTTLLQILGILNRQDSGKIIINHTDISLLKDKQLSRFRNQHIGFVFQFHHLLPEFTALENVCIPAFIAGKSKKEAEDNAAEILKYLGMGGRLNHKPGNLSGGEQQRVAIARALINNPRVILADEPTGNLDSKNTKELYDLFFKLREKYGQTYVIVTHNKELADLSDKQFLIRDGLIVG
jgi:lipoprotein-releasing system ATP-binding protein